MHFIPDRQSTINIYTLVHDHHHLQQADDNKIYDCNCDTLSFHRYSYFFYPI